MFVALLFAFVLLTAYAAEKLPSYIHVCGLKDPNYNECILDSVMTAKDKACPGMLEFDISPIEPIIIDKMVIFNTDNLKLNLEDFKIRGFCNFEVKSVNTSPDKLHFDIDVIFKHIDADSKYDFDIHLLVSLANKGMVQFSTDDADGKVSIDLKIETKNDKTKIYASKVSTKLNVKTLKIDFDDSQKDLVQLNEALKQTINDNQQEFFNVLRPLTEKKISEVIMSIINKIIYNRKEQLFPDEI